jgi:hypothetical protein
MHLKNSWTSRSEFWNGVEEFERIFEVLTVGSSVTQLNVDRDGA